MLSKVCKICNISQPLDKFHNKKGGKLGRRTECKACRKKGKENTDEAAKQRKHKWYIDNKKRILKERKDQYVVNQKDKLNYQKEYRKKNLERVKKYQAKYYIKNKHASAENGRRWRRANRDRSNSYARKRWDAEKNINLPYTVKDEQITRCVFNNMCAKCGGTNKLCIDHHLPLSRGYGLSIKNAVLLCNSCNSKKYVKLPNKFYTKRELFIIEQKLKIAIAIKGA